MAYVLEHTKLWFCWWDLLALLALVVLVVVYLVRRNNLKKEQKLTSGLFFALRAVLCFTPRVLFQALADPAFLCARESCLFTLPARPRVLPFCASRAVCESLFSHFSCRRRSLRGSPQNLQHKSSHSKNKFAGFLTRLGASGLQGRKSSFDFSNGRNSTRPQTNIDPRPSPAVYACCMETKFTI